MEFGKMHDISQIKFHLPADHPHTIALLKSLTPCASLPAVYVGCTGWSMKEWVGHVYPENTPPRDFLKHYGAQFNTIELNATHYRIPDAGTVANWREAVPQDFKYCPKIPQTISHRKDLGLESHQVEVFCEAIAQLGDRLGCCFIQLPPHWTVEKLSLLGYLLRRFPPHFRIAVEVRHPSWFNNMKNQNALFGLLEEANAASVITDVAGRRDVLHQRLTTSTAVIRFVGNGLHESDFRRVDDWVERLKFWFENGLREVYFFTHEPDNLQAPELADYVVRRVQARFAAVVRGPKFYSEEPTDQMSLF